MLKIAKPVMSALLVVAISCPALADPGNGKGNGNGNGKGNKQHAKHRKDDDYARGGPRYVADCPPGLAKKNPPCVPPGQARKVVYGRDVGDILRVGNYTLIRNPDRYDLRSRQGWQYYRDDDNIYRVDSRTQRVLAVLDLIRAFSN